MIKINMKHFNNIARIFIVILIFTFACLLNSCDMDKYLSANLNTSIVGDSTSISGVIKRKDNLKPINEATVKIGYYATLTDEFGGYHLDIPITNDDARNLPVPVVISAHKYISYYGIEYVTPLHRKLNVSLTYAAPIFVETGLTFINQKIGSKSIFSAIVKDFQGAGDVKEVIAITFDERYNRNVEIELIRKEILDELRSSWESEAYGGSLLVILGKIRVTFVATDYSGLSESLTRNF